MSARGAWPSAILVSATAFVVRLWHLSFVDSSPFASTLLGDAVGYDAWAREIAAGDWLGSEVFYQAPLYPYFLASLYSLVGDELVWVRLAQAALGALACGFLVLATTRFFASLSVGIFAGIMLAFYAPAIFHDALLQKSTLDLFLLCLLLWTLSCLLDRQRFGMCFLAGIVLGCLMLTRENATLLVFAIVAWMLFQFRANRVQSMASVLCFVLGLGCVLGPVAARNHTISGEIHLTTSQFGPNFYIGNHEKATGTYVPLRWGHGSFKYERTDATELAEIAMERKLSRREVSQYWQDRAMAFIAEQPTNWLRLTALKFSLFWNATEAIDTEDQYTHAEFSPLLAWTGRIFYFGAIAPLALLGVVVTWNRRQRLWILYLIAACYTASVLLFYVVARYRLPVVPILIPFAAAGIINFPNWLRNTRPSRIALTGIAVIVFAIFVHQDLMNRAEMRAGTYYNLGVAWSEQGKPEQAVAAFRTSIKTSPNHTQALMSLGDAIVGGKNRAGAILLYERALRTAPHVGVIHGRIGAELADQGHLDEARERFARAIELEPRLAAAHYGMALLLTKPGLAEQGFSHMEVAVTLDPSLLTQLRLTAFKLASGRAPKGSRQVAQALVLARWTRTLGDPDDPRTLDLLAVATAATGRYQRAIALTDKAIQIAEEANMAPLVRNLKRRRSFYVRETPFIQEPR